MTISLFSLLLCAGGVARAQGRTGGAANEDKATEAAEAPDRLQSMEALLRAVQAEQQALRQRVQELEQENKKQAEEAMAREVELLQMQAEAEAATGGEVVRQADEEGDLSRKVFRGGQRALQALNPEISLVGDAMLAGIISGDGYAGEDDRSGFVFRMVGLHFQSDLDPFAFTKITVGISPKGVSLGEAYLTWTSVLPGLSITAGQFRQEFGVVNRWHLPGLDQYDWPEAMRQILGPTGLNQVGVSLEWLMPKLWAHANHLVLQLTNGQSDHLFAGKFFSIPSALLRLKSYYDLTESTYFELGLTGMVGWNNYRGKADDDGVLQDEEFRPTFLWGADWSLVWEPLQQAKYRSLTVRGELYGARKELGAGRVQQAVGLYQMIQGKISRRWELGVRFDWSMPFAEDNSGQNIFGAQPYVTWWQSPWVRLRLHYHYTYNETRPAEHRGDHRLLLQATFAAGPHKHERY